LATVVKGSGAELLTKLPILKGKLPTTPLIGLTILVNANFDFAEDKSALA